MYGDEDAVARQVSNIASLNGATLNASSLNEAASDVATSMRAKQRAYAEQVAAQAQYGQLQGVRDSRPSPAELLIREADIERQRAAQYCAQAGALKDMAATAEARAAELTAAARVLATTK